MPCGLRPCLEARKASTSAKPAEDQQLTLFTATQNWVEGRNGRRFPLSQPLVAAGHFPRDGWKALIKVRGVVSTLRATSGAGVFEEAKRLHEINSEPFDATDLWLNLNLQWVKRVADKYQVVTPQALHAIAKPIP